MSYNKEIPYNALPDLPQKTDLETAGLLKSIKVGTVIYYVNHHLMNILSQ